jgi:O-antigen/teichoic acid export membrane protein
LQYWEDGFAAAIQANQAGHMKPFDSSGAFKPSGDATALRSLAVRGAGVTVLSQSVALGIQIVATVVLARLLTPLDFGVVAMTTAFSLILMNFGLNGFTEAVVQCERFDHALASNLFWINLGAGAALTFAFAGAGSLLAKFYRNPLVTGVAAGVSLTIFLTSMSVLHLALLKRAMLFGAVSLNDVVARTVSVIISIVFAWRGWGYWALVAGLIAQPLSTSIGAFAMCRWMPALPRRTEGTGTLVRFALSVYARFSVRYFSRNLDNILVGWRFDAAALGFYKKAYDLFALSADQLVSPLTIVAISALSRLRSDADQFRRYLLNSIALVAFLGMGIGTDLTLVGKDVIRLLLGPGWSEAGKIFVFFGPGIGFMLLHGIQGWIHLSLGLADRWLRWTIFEFVVTALLLSLGLLWGPVGVAVAWSVFFVAFTLPALWYAGRPLHLGAISLVAVTWKYVLAALLAGLASATIFRGALNLGVPNTEGGALAGILAVSVLFAVLYLGAVIALHGGCAPLTLFARLMEEMTWWGKRRGHAATASMANEAQGARQVV